MGVMAWLDDQIKSMHCLRRPRIDAFCLCVVSRVRPDLLELWWLVDLQMPSVPPSQLADI